MVLFDRSTRKPTLTAADKALLDYANNTLQSHREFLSFASSLDKMAEAEICIAIEQSVSYSALVPILSEFEKKYPFVELEILDSSSSDIAALVRGNRADIGMMLAACRT